MDIIKDKIELLKTVLVKNMYIYVGCIIFSFIYCNGGVIGDDITNIRYREKAISDVINIIHEYYIVWTSRLIPKFGYWLVGQLGFWGDFIFVAFIICLFVFSIVELADAKDKGYDKQMIFLLTMTFPYSILSTAGWLSTFWVYMFPAAMGTYACIIIKNNYYNEKISVMRKIKTYIALLLACNNELVCAIVGSIFIACELLEIIRRKKVNTYIVPIIIIVLSAIFIMTCPGNASRNTHQIAMNMPNYNMFNSISKIELGLANYQCWLLENNILNFFAVFFMLYNLMRKTVDELYYRIVSVTPIVIILLLGPLKKILQSTMPYLLSEFDYHEGFFKMPCALNGIGELRFYLLMIIIFCVCVIIYKLSEDMESCIINYVVYLVGIFSDIIIGFSPSIYFSLDRVHFFSTICFLIVCVRLFAENSFKINKDKKVIGVIATVGVINVLNLFLMIYTLGQ